MTMKSVEVPRYPSKGVNARLVCNYELGKERLYSVKWYKDGSEFYRYEKKFLNARRKSSFGII